MFIFLFFFAELQLRDAQHGGHYDSWRSTALAPQTLSPVQTGYYSGGGLGGYGIAEPGGYERTTDRRHYHRDAAMNPRAHHHYSSSHHSPSYTTGPRKPPQQYHPDYDTDF